MGARVGSLGEGGVADKPAPLEVPGKPGYGEEGFSLGMEAVPRVGVKTHCRVRTLRLDMAPVPGVEDTEVTVQPHSLVLTLFPGRGSVPS